MIRNSLLKEFNYDIKNDKEFSNDYEIFSDKQELSELRKKILEHLGDLSYLNTNVDRDIIVKIINQESLPYNLNNQELAHLYTIIENEINGYGPLTELLNDPNVSEIMVNSPNDIYIVIDSKIEKDNTSSFIDDEHILRTIKKMLLESNTKLDNQTTVETKLRNGDTLSVILPPISNGPILTIKKYNKILTNIDDMLKLGSLTPYMARFLEASCLANLNILVCGSNDSGKTMLLSSLGNLINQDNRVVLISKNNELDIDKHNKINLRETDDIVKTALNMYPNNILLDELDNHNSITIIETILNNSNIGFITTINASDALDAINKIERIYYKIDHISYDITLRSIAKAFDIIVTIKEMSDHKHKIVSIVEFNRNKNNDIVLKEIFNYKEKDGVYNLLRYIPRAYLKIKDKGINDIDDIFKF